MSLDWKNMQQMRIVTDVNTDCRKHRAKKKTPQALCVYRKYDGNAIPLKQWSQLVPAQAGVNNMVSWPCYSRWLALGCRFWSQRGVLKKTLWSLCTAYRKVHLQRCGALTTVDPYILAEASFFIVVFSIELAIRGERITKCIYQEKIPPSMRHENSTH